VGFSGWILTELITGAELVLDEDVSVFSPLHDTWIEKRTVRKRNMIILNEHPLFTGIRLLMSKNIISLFHLTIRSA
jgi:hypothetical protein